MGDEVSGRMTVSVGVVVIGRNEGERLKKCLETIVGITGCVVYVDSGSSDGSVEMARAMGVDVIEVDMRFPFTAARARNDGVRRLRELSPDPAYVQFLDGDCELVPGWLHNAALFLGGHEGVAVVSGRLREKYPERTIYNMLCDIEWDTPIGEAKSCGGVAMMRLDALESVQGYRIELIAGEEPELCVRLRAAGWRIWRMSEEMALHDAAISRFGQWWKRTLRSGYAFAQGANLHGAPPERHRVRESRSAWFWGLGIPSAVLGLAPFWGIWALVLLLIYPLQITRLALRGVRTPKENWWRAGFLVLGKFPEMVGQMKFIFDRYLGGRSRLIEYK